jgi:hypothetical protein
MSQSAAIPYDLTVVEGIDADIVVVTPASNTSILGTSIAKAAPRGLAHGLQAGNRETMDNLEEKYLKTNMHEAHLPVAAVHAGVAPDAEGEGVRPHLRRKVGNVDAQSRTCLLGCNSHHAVLSLWIKDETRELAICIEHTSNSVRPETARRANLPNLILSSSRLTMSCTSGSARAGSMLESALSPCERQAES